MKEMKQKSIRVIFLIFVFVPAFALGENIEDLLTKYKDASELYKKTRDESLGFLTIITREELDKMQGYTLLDVLKLVRFENIQVTRFGIETATAIGDYQSFPNQTKIYINDLDVSSLETNSPFLYFARLPLDFIDHIEIYYLGSSVRLADEPGYLVIKVYTKQPEKENSAILRTTLSSNAGYSINLLSARETRKDFSYLFFINKSYVNKEDLVLNNNTVKSDYGSGFLYFLLNYKKFSLDIIGTYKNQYPFLGFSTDGSPDKGKLKPRQINAFLTYSMFEDNSLKIKLGLTNDDINYKEYNKSIDGGLFLPGYDPIKPPVNLDINYNFKKYYFSINKEININESSLYIFGTFIEKNYDVKKGIIRFANSNSIDLKSFLNFTNEKDYFIGFENQWNINMHNLLLAGIRYDIFKRKNRKNFYPISGKLGYIYSNNNFTFKMFVGRIIITPSFYQEFLALRPLKQEKYDNISFETSYTYKNHFFRLMYVYVNAFDKIIVDGNTGFYINKPDKFETPLVSVDYTLSNLIFDKLSIRYYQLLKDIKPLSSIAGGYIRLFKTFDQVDIYSEVLYKKGFTLPIQNKKIKDTYDLTIAVSYNYKNKSRISIKGENLLNKGTNTPFFIPILGKIETFPVIERRILLTFEKSF